MTESQHYKKHFLIPEIDIIGQKKLKEAKVLVVGAGGLGCPILQYLTAAGIGTIGIVDGDIVCQSNLQRQILYTIDDIGLSKVHSAKKRLERLNPFINLKEYNYYLSIDNALPLLKEYDIIVDATDDFATRYLINDAAVINNKPVVYGAVYSNEGQVAVFNYNKSGTYRCLFPQKQKEAFEEFGVLGVLPGIIGCLQATEVIKLICGIKALLVNQVLTFNLLSAKTKILKYKTTSRAEVKILNDKY